MKNNQRQENGFKHCSNCYITIKDIIYTQWTDSCPTKTKAQKVKQDLKNQGYKAIIRFIDKCFYRVYREAK